MHKVYQTTFGTQGNCFAAACASLFEEPLEVWEPVACWREDGKENLTKILAARGMGFVEIKFPDDPANPVGIALEPGELVLIGVTSPNKLPHCVIGKTKSVLGGKFECEVVHDPLGDDINYEEIESVMFFYRRFQ